MSYFSGSKESSNYYNNLYSHLGDLARYLKKNPYLIAKSRQLFFPDILNFLKKQLGQRVLSDQIVGKFDLVNKNWVQPQNGSSLFHILLGYDQGETSPSIEKALSSIVVEKNPFDKNGQKLALSIGGVCSDESGNLHIVGATFNPNSGLITQLAVSARIEEFPQMPVSSLRARLYGQHDKRLVPAGFFTKAMQEATRRSERHYDFDRRVINFLINRWCEGGVTILNEISSNNKRDFPLIYSRLSPDLIHLYFNPTQQTNDNQWKLSFPRHIFSA